MSSYQTKSKVIFQLTLLSLFVLFVNFFRTQDAFTNPQFWAEDATVFYTQAVELGFQSIVTPYAGYLHTIQRVFSSVFNEVNFPLKFMPLLYNITSWFVICFSVCLISSLPFNLSKLTKVAIALALVLAPVGSEIFSNLTNIQWVAAVLLTCLFLVKGFSSYTKISRLAIYLLIFFLGLTGPFVILLLPLIFLRLYYYKDLSRNMTVYLVWLFTFIVQGVLIATTPRGLSQGSISLELDKWAEAFFGNFMGGYFIALGNTTSLVMFLSVSIFALFRVFSSRMKSDVDFYILALLGMCFAFAFAGLYSHKHDPQILTSYGAGQRYFYIPYVLFNMLLFVIFFNGERKERILFGLLIFVSLYSFYEVAPRYKYHDLNWYAYSEYSGRVDGLKVPINPVVPGWYLYPTVDSSIKKIENKRTLPESSFKFENVEIFNGYGKPLVAEHDSRIFFESIPCRADYTLYELVSNTLSANETVQLFFSDNEHMSEESSIRLPVVQGEGIYHFAISSGSRYLRLDPIVGSGEVTIHSLSAYCVDPN